MEARVAHKPDITALAGRWGWASEMEPVFDRSDFAALGAVNRQGAKNKPRMRLASGGACQTLLETFWGIVVCEHCQFEYVAECVY